MRCEPERKSYQNWHTLSLEQSSSSGGSSGGGGGPCGFCLFSRETMAAKGKGKKRRRTAYMVSARRQPVPPPPSYPLLQAGPQLHENAPSRAHARAAQQGVSHRRGACLSAAWLAQHLGAVLHRRRPIPAR